MKMNALITGANGFIGSNLCKELLEQGWNVACLLRRNTDTGYDRIQHIFDKINIVYYEDIINENKEWSKFPKFDVCFNLASYGVDYRKQIIDEIIKGNLLYTIDVLKFLSKVGVDKFINIGSCFEYGSNNGKKISEDHKMDPQSLYAAAKASTAMLSKEFAKSTGIKLITVRPFGVFGENEGMHRLIPQVMMACINNTQLNLTAGEQVRDYMYIKDLISGLILLAIKDIPSYEEFNICSGNEIILKDFILRIAEILDANKKLFIFGGQPYRKDEVMYYVGDNSKLKKYTKWEMNYTLERGIYNTYMWYKQKYSK